MNTPVHKSETPASLKPHRGAMILVLGILSIVMCVLFGVFAWIMGNNDLQEMDKGIMDPEGRGLTQAGKICGIIGITLQLLGIVIGILFYLLIALFAAGAVAAAR